MTANHLVRAAALGFALVTIAPALAVPTVVEAHGIKSASDLRTALNLLLAEHTVLAAAATNAALGGRSDEFEAAAGALDKNSVAIAGAVGLVYGKGAEDAFLPLWRKHIGFFVDYTMATAKKDMAAKDKAVGDLMAYTKDFGAFLESANKRLKQDAVADLVKSHVLTLAAVVDAQAAKDYNKAYEAEREAYAHMQHVGDALAMAIAQQYPKKFKQ